MISFRVSEACLWLLLPLALSHELRHTSTLYTSTENEIEVDFDKEARIKDSENGPTTLFVGGFQLAVEDEFTREACNRIEDQYISRTDCTCNRSMLQSSTVQFGCKNKDFICNSQNYCAQAVYTGAVAYETTALSTDFCLNNLQRDDKNFGNLCVAIDGSIEDSNIIIRRCLAKVGKKKCSCSICGDGRGVRVDCSGIHSRLISKNCDTVDIVTNINQEDRKVSGFFPSFMA